MDPMSHVSVNASHPDPAVTAARRRSGKAAMARETPPTRTSPPRLAKAKSTTACSAGLARSCASSLAHTGVALARSTSSMMGSPATAKPPLYKASEDKDEEFDDDGSEMIIGNLFPHGPGVVEAGMLVMSMGRIGRSRKAVEKMTILIFPIMMMPTACLTMK